MITNEFRHLMSYGVTVCVYVCVCVCVLVVTVQHTP